MVGVADIVTSRNTLFEGALEAIGFPVTGLGGRVRWMSPPDAPLGPGEHMLLKIDLAEGPHLADVGFGACVLDRPLQLKTDVEQRTAMETYRLNENGGRFWLSAKTAGWLANHVRLQSGAANPSRLRAGQLVHLHKPARMISPSTLVMERVSSDKRYKLINRRFAIEARDGEIIQEHAIASAEELDRVPR